MFDLYQRDIPRSRYMLIDTFHFRRWMVLAFNHLRTFPAIFVSAVVLLFTGSPPSPSPSEIVATETGVSSQTIMFS